MNKKKDFENYLSISPNKFGIYLFDTINIQSLYKEELVLNKNHYNIDFDILKKFLENNIFKIEKLSGKFIENIFLVFEGKKIFNLDIGIKRKNYDFSITKEYLENSLIDVKDLFRENYPNQEIMHMIINKYLINKKTYLSFEENLKSDQFALEIQFKSISKNIIYDLSKALENYQIKIIKCVDGSYVENYFNKDIVIDLPKMSHRILNGCNENEISFLPKNSRKLGFFEKFFQLFS